MKLLKYAGLTVAVLAGIFLSIGFFVPSFSYESRIEVNAPLAQAFAVFNDPSRMGEWMSGFKSIETISGNPNEVGSRYRLVIVENGEEMVTIEEMTAFQKNERFGFRRISDALIAKVEIRFTDQDGRTVITDVTRVEGRNFLWKSLLPLFKSMMVDKAHENYGRLKQVIESSVAAL